MKKPYKFTAYNKETSEETQFNDILLAPYGWRMNKTSNWTVFENKRYNAALRLYNYITYKKHGERIPKNEPYKGTEIGKTVPILNF